MRCSAVGITEGVWRYASQMRKIASALPSAAHLSTEPLTKELEMVKLENYQLKAKLESLQAEVKLHQLKEEQLTQLKTQVVTSDYLRRRKEELFQQLELYSHAITARVIFRESSAWKSSVWINVGQETNQKLSTPLISHNSPVVLGTTVVGIIDYVGKTRSRVRLVTDPAVMASIRVIRGNDQRKIILQEVRQALTHLALCENQDSPTPSHPFIEQFLSSFSEVDHTTYLAKGELKGSYLSKMKTRGTLLKGTGFNYDFPDKEGAARELRSGKVKSGDEEGICLIQAGDVIITTGMDGLFPAGLNIGVVKEVSALQEGQSFYEAKITSSIPDFDQISFVTVLPSLSK
ncbi:hypothetical protein ACTFIV_006936 [Dictyostelium citrinum]